MNPITTREEYKKQEPKFLADLRGDLARLDQNQIIEFSKFSDAQHHVVAELLGNHGWTSYCRGCTETANKFSRRFKILSALGAIGTILGFAAFIFSLFGPHR